MSTVPTPRRGEVWLVDFDPSVGAEIRKLRPAVVVSVDTAGRLPLRVVVPVTDWKPQYATYAWFTFIAASREEWTQQGFGRRRVSGKVRLGDDASSNDWAWSPSAELDDIAMAVSLVVGKSLRLSAIS